MVYKNKNSDDKVKKYHTDNISEKVSGYGSDNKLIAYLVSASDNAADSNGDTISNINCNII